MDSVGDIFAGSLARYSKQPEFKSGMVALAWEKVLGPEVAAQVQLVRVDANVAWVRTSSPAWAHQLTFLKLDVLAKLAAMLGPKAIIDIRVARGLAKSRPAPEPERVPVPLAGPQQALVLECQQQVQDKNLAEALRKGMAAMLQRQAELERKGFLSCSGCGSLTDDAERLCTLCRLQARAARRDKVVAVLRDRPWSNLWDARMQVSDLDAKEYGKLRAQLLRTTWADVASWLDRHKKALTIERAIAEEVKIHVMLRAMRPWDRVGADTVAHYTGPRVKFLMERSGFLHRPV
jgi:hypothetical protein